MISLFKKQIKEISTTPGLRLYGAFLTLSHLWTFILWNNNDYFVTSLGPSNSIPLCFPFLPNCDLYRVFSETNLSFALYLYLVLTVLCSLSFLKEKHTHYAYGLFLALFVYKNLFYLSNFNFMGNYHYMLNIVYIAFLFFPHKKNISKYLIVGFYVAAGALKINPEWLTGAAMIAPAMISGKFFTASLIYVIYLELFFIFGLLAKTKWVRWLCLAQLVGFHLFSWHIVGFFYPMVMFSILSLFFIDEYFYYKNILKAPDLLSLFFYGKANPSTYTTIALFTFMQVAPLLFAHDPSLSGSLRLTSLNMFDANTRCHSLMVTSKEGQVVHLRKNSGRLGVRIQCDPIVFINQIHQLCRENEKHKEFDKLSFSLVSRRSTQIDFQPVLFLKNACSLKNKFWAEFYQWGVF